MVELVVPPDLIFVFLAAVTIIASILALYMKLYLMSSLVTVLFLGGWWGPSFLPQPVWFIIKTLIVCTFIIIPRGVYARIRVDMLIKIGWTRLLIIALANVFLTVLLISTGLTTALGI